MTMDLWYDLAARELPDLDDVAIEKLEGVDAVLVDAVLEVPEPRPEAVVAVDFF